MTDQQSNTRLAGSATGAVASAYLASEQASAAPQRLSVLLYDGAIRLCREALLAVDAGKSETAARRLARAMETVGKLRNCLAADEPPADTSLFEGLYEQVHRRLVEAGFYRRRESISETISLLLCQRPAWGRFAGQISTSARRAVASTGERSWIG